MPAARHSTIPTSFVSVRDVRSTRGRIVWSPMFIPTRQRPFRLDPDVAFAAIEAYNRDPAVLRQELRAFARLPGGFTRGEVQGQLRALSAAYSARCPLRHQTTISARMEAGWEAFHRGYIGHRLAVLLGSPETARELAGELESRHGAVRVVEPTVAREGGALVSFVYREQEDADAFAARWKPVWLGSSVLPAFMSVERFR